VSKQRRALGRGLNALIPTAEMAAPAVPTGTAVVEIPVAKVSANPHQPRQALDQESLAELAASIRTHGVLQPLVVTKVDDGYQIIAGERRWRAAELAGLESVPVLIKESTSQQMLELALVENIQRADLNPLEEANAYRQLMDEFGLTQEEVAEQVGKSRASVANTVRLLKLPDEVKEALAAGHISEGHARALLALPTTGMQRQALATIQKHGLNVRQAETLVRQMQVEPEESHPAESPPPLSPLDREVVERFQTRLGTKVNLIRGKRGGRLVIHFYSDEELQAIYETVVESEESQ
jgi:ParB family chromosome partitioning protein